MYKPAQNFTLTVIVFVIAFTGCKSNAKSSDKPQPAVVKSGGKTEQYVSMDCQKGDITLGLKPDSSFNLNIQYWDNATKQHTGQESITGTWSKGDKNLVLLSSDNNMIIYQQDTTSMQIGTSKVVVDAYRFKSNMRDFFASGYELLEKEQTDKFLSNAVNAKGK